MNVVILSRDKKEADSALKAVQSSGMNSFPFDTSEEALNFIVKNPKPARQHPGLLIADTDIDKALDGLEFIKKLRSLNIMPPTILISNSKDRDTLKEAMRLRCRDFIDKPLDSKSLSERIKKLVSEIRRRQARKKNSTATRRINLVKSVGNYKLVKVLGEGSSGIVFLCENADTKEHYAVKLLHLKIKSAKDGTDDSISQFINESTAISQLNHPNIINFVEFGFQGAGAKRHPYIVMEYFNGRPLSFHINNNDKTTLDEKIHIIKQLVSALEAVHEKGIIHRDIKPENILVDKDLNVKITDFGVCHLPTSGQADFLRGIIGTPRYIAPEYFRKGRIDQRGDIYSLGMLSYELLLGIRPFFDLPLKDMVRKTLKEYPLEPLKINEDFPWRLQEIIAQMLRKKPKKRYENAADILKDLEDFESSMEKSLPLTGKMRLRLSNSWK